MSSTFEPPAPDVQLLINDWEEWERGEATPGKVLSNLKTHGMRDLLQALAASGWQPQS
ncbi:MAG: hypothetical protein R2715_12635 [Ilumatobacteraceae bacterium]